MIDGSSFQALKVNILNTDHIRVGTEWNYTDVYGPYHRLYLVLDGHATVRHHEQDFHLTPGVLHFVPGYVRASYKCDSSMDCFYILFACELEGHFDLFSETPLQFQILASQLDTALFNRFLELNPSMALIETDPKKYHKGLHFHRAQNYCNEVPLPRFLESKSIVVQLLSRFLIDQLQNQTEHREKNQVRIEETIRYVKEHTDQKITVTQLADMVSLTPDHFSKIFKQIMAVRPIEYINQRRLQRVKLLLLTTNMSVERIAYKVGFASTSYFLRVFKKYEDTTPANYRKNATIT